MQLVSASISGYRSLQAVEVKLIDLTACIGPNGSGKSSFLGALRLFFEPSSEVSDYDFWSGAGAERAEVISIKITFSDLDEHERDRFSEYLKDDTLTFERRFEESGKGVYLAQRLAVPEFSRIRMLQRSHRDEYNALVSSGEYEGLETAASKDDAFEKMVDWERGHPERCELRDEEVDVVDEILRSVTFVPIGAFDDPSEHVEAEGKGAVGRLLDRVVDRDGVQERLQAVADAAAGKSDEILDEASDGFQRFERLLRENLNRFAPGSNLTVSWERPEIKSSRPRLQVEVETSDGLATPLEYQGHGVQRALMYAALTAQAGDPGEDEDDVVLLIEEPEAFQHPLSCRVLTTTLRELSGRNYQLVYSTHSPYFIHADLIEGLKVFRREDKDGHGASTTIESWPASTLLAEWERVFEGDGFTVESVLARLRSHLPPRVLEGLFARACILVEGDEDEAVIRGTALQSGVDLDAAGLAVIQTNGKTGMPNVLTFYELADLESYPVFDLDRGKSEEEQHREAEIQILRALRVDEEPAPGINDDYACWQWDLTRALQDDIGDPYDELLEQASSEAGYHANRGRKVPTVIASLIQLATEEEIETPMLSALADRLRDLADAS